MIVDTIEGHCSRCFSPISKKVIWASPHTPPLEFYSHNYPVDRGRVNFAKICPICSEPLTKNYAFWIWFKSFFRQLPRLIGKG